VEGLILSNWLLTFRSSATDRSGVDDGDTTTTDEDGSAETTARDDSEEDSSEADGDESDGDDPPQEDEASAFDGRTAVA
jgi:hypothetical protein